MHWYVHEPSSTTSQLIVYGTGPALRVSTHSTHNTSRYFPDGFRHNTIQPRTSRNLEYSITQHSTLHGVTEFLPLTCPQTIARDVAPSMHHTLSLRTFILLTRTPTTMLSLIRPILIHAALLPSFSRHHSTSLPQRYTDMDISNGTVLMGSRGAPTRSAWAEIIPTTGMADNSRRSLSALPRIPHYRPPQWSCPCCLTLSELREARPSQEPSRCMNCYHTDRQSSSVPMSGQYIVRLSGSA